MHLRKRAFVFSLVHSRWGRARLCHYCGRMVQWAEITQCKGSAAAQGGISVKLLLAWDGQRLWESTAQRGGSQWFVSLLTRAIFLFYPPRFLAAPWIEKMLFVVRNAPNSPVWLWFLSNFLALLLDKVWSCSQWGSIYTELHSTKCPWVEHCVTSSQPANSVNGQKSRYVEMSHHFLW